MRIIIECPENILHLEAGYIYADLSFVELQTSCSLAADHTFRQSWGMGPHTFLPTGLIHKGLNERRR